MDSRLYFVIGDITSNVLVGAVAGWLCTLAVGEGWNMLPAMLLAMAMGMLVALVLFLPLGTLFGAMEVMLPTMFGGMASGMVVGMWTAMEPLTIPVALVVGGLCGLASLAVIWILNHFLRGPRTCGGED